MKAAIKRRLAAGFVLFIVCCCSTIAFADIQINELLAATSQEDASSTRLEWIELKNSGSTAVSLEGYSLSDDPLAPRKWLLPSITLPPNGLVLIYATGYGLIKNNEYHANFQLDRDGETLLLISPSGAIENSIAFPNQQLDVSYGRISTGEWRFFTTPSPNVPNPDTGFIGYLDSPTLSQPGGVYSSNLSVVLTPPTPEAQLRYTTDGAEPTLDDIHASHTLPIRRTTVLRARAFQDGYGPSPIVTHTYVIRDEQPLPIMSFVSDPDHFFDPRTGLVPNAGMHGPLWERPVSVEWIDANGVRQFGVDCGVRIHGGASRGRSPKKSFRLYFRDEYGPTRLRYPLIPDTPRDNFNNLVIRGGFNDTWGYDNSSQRPTAILVSDQVTRDLHKSIGGGVAHGVFAELFINGESWGIYNPTERITDVFNQYYFGGEEWDVVSDFNAVEGDLDAWREMGNAFTSVRRTEPFTLDIARRRLDLQAFTDYIILNIWLQNYDWPHHNWYAARERTSSGRWRFFLWDVEYSFGSGGRGYMVNQDTFDTAINRGNEITEMVKRLFVLPEYKDMVWRRLKELQQTHLSPERVHAALDKRVNEVRELIPLEAELYGTAKPPDPKKTPADFENAVGLAHDFIDRRWRHVLRLTEQYLGPAPVSIDQWELY